MEKKEKIKKLKKQSAEEKMATPLEKGKEETITFQKPNRYEALIIFVSAVFLFMVIISGSTAYYYYNQYKRALKNSVAESKSELQVITDKIGGFMELPEGEDPTLATVTDVEKIKGQKFFAQAENGDKVLIYAESGKAILYRPLTGKIIEVSAVSGKADEVVPVPTADAETQNSETIPPVTAIEAPAKVAVYNGGRIKGLAQKIADSLSQMTGIEITEKTNAEGKYKKTLVVDLTGDRQELARKIAETLGGEAGAMPEGELKPEADILIIGGSDF